MQVELGGAVRTELVPGAVLGLVAATILATFLGVALLTFVGERLVGMEAAIWGAEALKPVYPGLLAS